jgi:hypothetical protein
MTTRITQATEAETCTEQEPEVRRVSGEVLTRPLEDSPRLNLAAAERIRQEMARV